jgi:uncharacterized protein YjdB
LLANVAPPDATDTSVTWISSFPKVASVDANGLVTARSQGSVTIEIVTNDGGFKSTCAIGVMSTGIPVSGVTITGCSSENLPVGETRQLDASISPSNARNHNVSWYSPDTSIAQIDANGLVTAISNGEVTISVLTNDGAFRDECRLKVGMVGNISTSGSAGASVEVYPNPVSGKLFVTFPEPGLEKQVKVYTMSGQILLDRTTHAGQMEIDVGGFSGQQLIILEVFTRESVAYFKVLTADSMVY